MPEFQLVTEVEASPERCFALSLSVDAHTDSMGESGECAVAGVTSGTLTMGDTVTWEARHFGLPFRMTSKITACERPTRFIDEQVTGPFGSWWHEHRFQPTETGTLMTDVIRFRSPFGPLGALVDALVLRRYMTRLIVTRNAWLKAQLDSM